jgi:hypothetical protein
LKNSDPSPGLCQSSLDSRQFCMHQSLFLGPLFANAHIDREAQTRPVWPSVNQPYQMYVCFPAWFLRE